MGDITPAKHIYDFAPSNLSIQLPPFAPTTVTPRFHCKIRSKIARQVIAVNAIMQMRRNGELTVRKSEVGTFELVARDLKCQKKTPL